MEIFDSEIVE